MLRRASTDSWWTPADALYLLPVTTALWLCSDLHQHLLPGYNTGSTYTFCSYIHTVLPLRTTLNSFLFFFFSSDFPAGLFCIVTYLIPSFSGLVGETENQRQRGSLQHIQRSKRTRYLHGIWTICIFLRSVDSLLSHCLIEYASWSARDAALVQIFPCCFFYNPPPRSFLTFPSTPSYYPLLSYSWKYSVISLVHHHGHRSSSWLR